MQNNSWTSTLLFESLITLTASTVLVRSISPSGIIPIIAATVCITASFNIPPSRLYWFKNNKVPTGIIIIDTVLIILFSEFIISEFTFFTYLVCFEIFEVKLSSPICSTWALHLPLITKLPDKIISPSFFVIAFDSPVIKDSSTSISPCLILQSVIIWFPVSNSNISSSTISFISIFSFFLFLMQFTFVVEIKESLSITLFECISWNVLIAVFITTRPINSIFLYSPTAKTAKASSKFIRLNIVKKLLIIIDFILLVGEVVSKLTSPSFFLFSTWLFDNPSSIFGLYLSIFSFISCFPLEYFSIILTHLKIFLFLSMHLLYKFFFQQKME